MNRPSIEQLMDEKFESLPSVVKEIIESDDIGEKIDLIAQKTELKEEQTELLADEVGYVLFGLTSITAFKKTIQDNLGLVPSKALAISTELYGSVFQPVKKFLKDIDESELDPMQRRSMDGVTIVTKPSILSVPVKSQPATTSPKPVAATTQQSVTIDLDEDTESLSHHDILREIENPTPSVARQESASAIPEETHFELEGEALDSIPYGNSSNIPASGSSYNSNADMFRQISAGSIHHDIVPNLNGFKPLDSSASEASQAGVHLNTPMTDPLSRASETAGKLDQKLEGIVSSTPKEVYVAQKPSALKLDPYREPVE